MNVHSRIQRSTRLVMRPACNDYFMRIMYTLIELEYTIIIHKARSHNHVDSFWSAIEILFASERFHAIVN